MFDLFLNLYLTTPPHTIGGSREGQARVINPAYFWRGDCDKMAQKSPPVGKSLAGHLVVT